MLKKYQTIEDLKDRADLYFKKHKLVAPREFRLWLGVSKHLLSTWKKTEPEYFNLIKTYEDFILSKVEAYAIYGQAHPDIAAELTRTVPVKTYYADKFDSKGKLIAKGSLKTERMETITTGKYNQVGAIFIMRAYDKELYVPEIAKEQETEELLQVQVITHDKTPEKGAQSGREIKLIK